MIDVRIRNAYPAGILAAFLVSAVALATAAPAWSQQKPASGEMRPTAAPLPSNAIPQQAPTSQTEGYKLTGFRSSRFGMGRDELTAAIQKDFGSKAVRVIENPSDGTTGLVVDVGALEPSPGMATVTYILGRQSKRLIHVNVVWALDANATAVDRDLLTSAGLKLALALEKRKWPKGKFARNVPVGNNSLVLLQAQDESGAAVEVRADGISFSQQRDGHTETSPSPTGPAVLKIAYAQNPDNPDIVVIKDGQF